MHSFSYYIMQTLFDKVGNVRASRYLQMQQEM